VRDSFADFSRSRPWRREREGAKRYFVDTVICCV
jgi:hypothetical protein